MRARIHHLGSSLNIEIMVPWYDRGDGILIVLTTVECSFGSPGNGSRSQRTARGLLRLEGERSAGKLNMCEGGTCPALPQPYDELQEPRLTRPPPNQSALAGLRNPTSSARRALLVALMQAEAISGRRSGVRP